MAGIYHQWIHPLTACFRLIDWLFRKWMMAGESTPLDGFVADMAVLSVGPLILIKPNVREARKSEQRTTLKLCNTKWWLYRAVQIMEDKRSAIWTAVCHTGKHSDLICSLLSHFRNQFCLSCRSTFARFAAVPIHPMICPRQWLRQTPLFLLVGQGRWIRDIVPSLFLWEEMEKEQMLPWRFRSMGDIQFNFLVWWLLANI